MTIGVFDSGVGGLTVLNELLRLVPHADYLYFGDTARLPYGSKSAETVARYAISSARLLQERGATLMVIACNTATALAMPQIEKSLSVPALGVIAPGAQRVAAISRSKSAVVIGTEGTVASGAYPRALAAYGISATQKACPLFVPLVEEGWTDHSVTEEVARIYLSELFSRTGNADRRPPSKSAAASDSQPDVLLLGCTHYPLLKPLLRRLVPAQVSIVDSAESTAQKVAEIVSAMQKENPSTPVRPSASAAASASSIQFFVTDSVEKFQRLGQRFFSRKIENVSHLDLET
jgi:glutamate racemase